MRVLVKLGGTLLDKTETRRRIAAELAQLAGEHEMVVVHGGGKQVTKFLDEQGIESRFTGGLRVSDEIVIDAVCKVIAGSVNKQLVSALIAEGCSAVGLSGVDGRLTPAVQLSPDLGLVGDPEQSDPRLLKLLIESGYLPVIACVAGDAKGNIYNVNADRMAVSCAAGWQATKLLFLTDVPGVKNAKGQVISELTQQGSSELVRSGVASGGMQAKLESAGLALELGIEEVVIASGREMAICSRLLAGEPAGTRLHGRP